MKACTAEGVVARYVPPGAVGALSPFANLSVVDHLSFLGSVGPQTWRWFCMNRLRRQGKHPLIKIENQVWTVAANAIVMNRASTFMSLSQRFSCDPRRKPPPTETGLDTFRVAHLLGHRALIIGHHTDLLDEQEYAGMMSFSRFADIGAEWERIRAMSLTEREALANERFALFQAHVSAIAL